MDEVKDQSVQPARGKILPEAERSLLIKTQREGFEMTTQVGKPAPDFETSAFADGGFKNIKLSDYRGQWVVLCFYPGDFTFV